MIQLNKNSSKQIECFVKDVDLEFCPSLSSKVDIRQWSKKLNERATNIAKVNENGDIEALISFYSNADAESYLTFMAVGKAQRGKKLASYLLDSCIEFCTKDKSKSIKVDTWPSNEQAISIYQSKGFILCEVEDEQMAEKIITLRKRL